MFYLLLDRVLELQKKAGTPVDLKITKENMKTTEMIKGLQRCHEQFLNSLTYPNVKELTAFLFTNEIFTFEEKQTVQRKEEDATERMKIHCIKSKDSNFYTLVVDPYSKLINYCFAFFSLDQEQLSTNF